MTLFALNWMLLWRLADVLNSAFIVGLPVGLVLAMNKELTVLSVEAYKLCKMVLFLKYSAEVKLEIDTNTALLVEFAFNTISPTPTKLIREEVEPAVKTVRFEVLSAPVFTVEVLDITLTCEYP